MKILRYGDLAVRGLGQLREGLAEHPHNPFARPLGEALWGEAPWLTLLGGALVLALLCELPGLSGSQSAIGGDAVTVRLSGDLSGFIVPVFALLAALRVRHVLFRETEVLREWVADDERASFEALAVPLVHAGIAVVMLATLTSNLQVTLVDGMPDVRPQDDLARHWQQVQQAEGAARGAAWVALGCDLLTEALFGGALFALAVASLCGSRQWFSALLSVLWRTVGFGFSVKGVLILVGIVNGLVTAALVGLWSTRSPDTAVPQAVGRSWEELSDLAVHAVLCGGLVGGVWIVARASLAPLLERQHVEVLERLDALVEEEQRDRA